MVVVSIENYSSFRGISSDLQKLILGNRPWVEEPGGLPTAGSQDMNSLIPSAVDGAVRRVFAVSRESFLGSRPLN